MKFSNYGWVLSFILLTILFFQRGCEKKCPEVTSTSDTVIVYTTITDTFIVTKKELRYTDVVKEVPQIVDTGAILKDHFTQRLYTNEYNFDSTLSLKILDTVSENKIQGRSVIPTFRFKTTTITNTVTTKEPSRNKIFIGGTLMIKDFNQDASVFINASFLSKRDAMFTVGYEPFQKAGMVMVQKKIRLHK